MSKVLTDFSLLLHGYCGHMLIFFLDVGQRFWTCELFSTPNVKLSKNFECHHV